MAKDVGNSSQVEPVRVARPRWGQDAPVWMRMLKRAYASTLFETRFKNLKRHRI